MSLHSRRLVFAEGYIIPKRNLPNGHFYFRCGPQLNQFSGGMVVVFVENQVFPNALDQKLKYKCIQIDFARELQFSTIFTKNILETKCNQKIYIIFAQDLIHLSIYVVILACGWLLFDLIISKQKLISNYIEFTYFTAHLVIKNEMQYPLSANFQH